MEHEIDRIECAIRHIESSLDVDPWACDLPEKERTECATIDMWGSYKDALMTFTFMTPFFGKKKSVEVGDGTDIDVLSEQISEIVEIRQRLGRINRYANKFKFWEEKHNENRSN